MEERLTGRKDYEITEMGKKYIEKLTEKLKSVKFDVAYASTSERTIKTIQNLASENHIEIIPKEELCEMDFGIYDGMRWSEVNRINPKIHQLHKETNEIMGIPGQETTKQVQERMYQCLEQIAQKHLGKTVLICSHGVAIECFLRKVDNKAPLEEIYEYGQENASINIVEYDSENRRFQVLLLNEFKYLENKEEEKI